MITTTKQDRHGILHENMVWLSSNGVQIGYFKLIGNVEWRFMPGIISGLTSAQLRLVADELDNLQKQ